jgi:CheY-like chemotaxis protein
MTRVLVVEDSAAVRLLVAQILEGAGYSVIPAETAADALAVVSSDPPEVAVVDEHLAESDGHAFIRALRAHPDPRVRSMIAIGISSREGSEQRLMAAGAHCSVRKPFHQRDLLRAVRWGVDVYGGAEP